MISSRIFAVCSTTNATGNDENVDIDGWTSSTIESSASTAAVVVVWDDCASGGGKFVIGDIGASLMNFLQFLSQLISDKLDDDDNGGDDDGLRIFS